jgi:DNA-binding IclR family transcriptional regulator
VRRAFDVLDELARNPGEPLTISEIARRTGMARATADSVLLALAERGLVKRGEDDRRFALGPTCIFLGDAARATNAGLSAAAEEAEQLARELSAFVAVSILEGREVRIASVSDFGPPFAIRARVGQSIPLVPPFGAVFVAWEGAEVVDQWLERGDLSAQERDRYLRALESIRRNGYSVAIAPTRREELAGTLESLTAAPTTPGEQQRRDRIIHEISHGEYLLEKIGTHSAVRVSQISAPVFDSRARVTVSIRLLGSGFEMDSGEIEILGSRLRDAAARATRASGGVAG